MILLSEDFWEIKKTKKKGRGIFAKKDVLPGIVIGDYIGKVIKTAENEIDEQNGLYLMYYHDYASIYPTNPQAPGIHLINHSCTPNSWIYIYKGHTLFFTLRHIFKGEELTASYLLSSLDSTCNPCIHECFCGSKYCLKTMHLPLERFKKWSKFNEMQSKQTKRARIRYGYNLPKLDSYPKTIPDNSIYTLTGSFLKSSIVLNNTTLPTIQKLREAIKKTGRTIKFPTLKIKIMGVEDDRLIQEELND